MQIVQLLPTLSYGDAVGNDAIALRDELVAEGYYSRIYAENIHPRLGRDTVLPFAEMPPVGRDDIVIYHLSTGSWMNRWFAQAPCRKVVVYHNSTPPEFFFRKDHALYQRLKDSQREIRLLAPYVDYVLADSEFNKQDLIEKGYRCPIDVLPILIPFSDYDAPANPRLLAKYSDTAVNLLHTGRIAPNKKIEDVIAAFECYHRVYHRNSRLFLVGSFQPDDMYYRQLRRYVRALGLQDSVIFPGHISFRDVLTYYHLADAYLCMSEHEGFCVPLVEAMYFGIPIVAYRSTAIPETLGGAGLLLDEKKPMETAAAVDWLMRNPEHRESIAAAQRARLRDFSHERIAGRFETLFGSFVEGAQ